MNELTRMERLDLIRKAAEHCDRCDLAKTRKCVVFGSGSVDAKLVIIGEAPGEDEDLSGVPFVGESGMLLNWCLRKAGIVRRSIFITNTLCCRPPDNRDPLPAEQRSCYQRLLNTIDLIEPKCLLLLGKPAAQLILGHEVSILRERGQRGNVFIAEMSIPYVLAVHPSFILRQVHGFYAYRTELAQDVQTAWDIAQRSQEE
jgi:uracil-DNA glycosylase family 4